MGWLNWDRYAFVIADIETGRFVEGFSDYEEAEAGANKYALKTLHKVVIIDNTMGLC